ncbi:MAG: hypothetical protein V9F01_00980 [Chitinophagaceae bacterium]
MNLENQTVVLLVFCLNTRHISGVMFLLNTGNGVNGWTPGGEEKMEPGC